MCYNHVDIDMSSRIKNYHPGFSQLCSLTVPCGHCEDCLLQAQNDIMIRSISEFEDCINSGGKVSFLTFTYSNDHVPLTTYSLNEDCSDINFSSLFYKDIDGSKPWVFNFCKVRIQKMLNSVRKNLERLGVVNAFRYMIVPEYGSDNRYTQRPHFHAIFYLSPDFLKHYPSSLGIFQRYWSYGMVSISKEYGEFLSNIDAIKYTSKYLSKTFLLTRLRQFKKFYNFIKANISTLNPIDYKYDPTPHGLFRYYMRKTGSSLFVLKSINYGGTELKRLRSFLINSDYSTFSKIIQRGYPLIKDGQTTYLRYPSYYFRKLFYDINEDGTYKLNIHGYQFRKYTLEDSIESDMENISNIVLDNLFSDSSNNSAIWKKYYDFLLSTGLFDDPHFLWKFSVYRRLVRGRSFPRYLTSRIFNFFLNDSRDRDKHLVDRLFDINNGFVFLDDSSNLSNLDFESYRENNPLYFDVPFFYSDYECYNALCNACINLSRKKKGDEISKNNRKLKLISDIINFQKYNSESTHLCISEFL